jgi:carbamoyl-phosphate synthase small subunit
VVPAITTAQEIEAFNPDGVFLSNGPGDPEPCLYAIKTIREILRNKVPVFGICLGHQLLALAAGAKTKKMKFGHHGANHPVQDLKTKEVFITSQNHGFTVDEDNLPEEISITHRSLFDDSIQGIAIKNSNAFSFQGHPEASPGPHDINPLFVKFSNLMKNA